MFPGRTVAAQKKMQANFANDLATRCHAEHPAAMSATGGHGNTGKANTSVMTAKESMMDAGESHWCAKPRKHPTGLAKLCNCLMTSKSNPTRKTLSS